MVEPGPIVAPLATGERDSRERQAAVRVLARAFRDNPLTAAIVGGGPRRRIRSNAMGMRALMEVSTGSGQSCGARIGARGLAGVLVSAPPGCFPLPSPRPSTQLRSLMVQGWRILRDWGRVYRALEAVHPTDPHWYLSILGVDPEQQRQGLGSALLADFLRRVDAQAKPSYLETDRPENVAFYERAGFEVARELRLMAVPVWCMWRPAR